MKHLILHKLFETTNSTNSSVLGHDSYDKVSTMLKELDKMGVKKYSFWPDVEHQLYKIALISFKIQLPKYLNDKLPKKFTDAFFNKEVINESFIKFNEFNAFGPDIIELPFFNPGASDRIRVSVIYQTGKNIESAFTMLYQYPGGIINSIDPKSCMESYNKSLKYWYPEKILDKFYVALLDALSVQYKESYFNLLKELKRKKMAAYKRVKLERNLITGDNFINTLKEVDMQPLLDKIVEYLFTKIKTNDYKLIETHLPKLCEELKRSRGEDAWKNDLLSGMGEIGF